MRRATGASRLKPAAVSATAPTPSSSAPDPTGLSAAFHLGEDSILLEQNSITWAAGAAPSSRTGGFTFDYAGHIMFSNDPYVHQLYKMLLGDNVHWQDREAWIYSKDVFTRYPFPGLALRPAAGGHPGVHRGSDRVSLRLAGAGAARFGNANGKSQRNRGGLQKPPAP